MARRDSDVDRRRVILALRPRGEAILEAISQRNLGRLNEGADILAGIIEAARRGAAEPLAPRPQQTSTEARAAHRLCGDTACNGVAVNSTSREMTMRSAGRALR